MLVVGVVSWWWIGYSVLVPSGYHCSLPSIRDNGPIPTPEVQFPVRVAVTRGRPSCAARLGGWAVRR